MTTVTVVPATVAHLPWLRVLFDRFVAELPVAYPTMDAAESDRFVQSVYAHLTQNPLFACFVALAGDEVVGFVGGEITDRFIGRPHRVGNAHWLYVAPAYRAQGVGRALIAAGVAWMTQYEVNDLECFGLAGDDGWARRGFHPFLVRYRVTLAELAAGPQPPRVVNATPAPRLPRRRKRARANGVDRGTDAVRE